MDLARYAALFLAESREHLAACNRLLLEWERVPAATEPVAGLFRALHTIKGMAATMGYATVAELAHAAEGLLEAVREKRVPPSAPVFQLLFRTVDRLSADVEHAAVASETSLDIAVVGTLVHELVAASTGSQGAAEADAPPRQPTRAEAIRALPVRVAIRPGAMMRGGRAALVLRRAAALGEVTVVRPPVGVLEREEFDGRFTFRLATNASEPVIEAGLRGAGEVLEIGFDDPGVIATAGRHSRQVRVEQARLDTLMKQVGELVVARNRLSAISAGADDPALADVAARVGRLASAMQVEVIAARMTPVSEVFERFPRIVRDLSQELGKRIRLEAEGGDIELDRSVIDELGEPLLHLVRNACDHGIEPADVRQAAGKPPEGRVTLSALRERNSVGIRVSDDGRGIDRDAVAASALSEGRPEVDAGPLSDDQLLRVLARPGFSTAREVSEVSGRGVGVDVAMTRVRALGGTLEVQSTVGQGTTFLLRVPFTLAIVRALLAESGGERYAVPLACVAETVEYDPRAMMALRDREALLVRDRLVPTIHLRELVGRGPRQCRPRSPTLILELGDRRRALVADALLGQQDIVIEAFDAPSGMPNWVGGATILADGAPALILDAAALL